MKDIESKHTHSLKDLYTYLKGQDTEQPFVDFSDDLLVRTPCLRIVMMLELFN